VVTDVNLLLVEKHTVNVLDGLRSGLIGLVVNETITLGVAVLILGNLAAQDVTESSKGVVESLVVDGNIEVLDENVALASLAKSGITLGPHDTAGAALDDGVVEVLESLLAVSSSVVVDVGIAERATGDGITADTDRSNSANLGEKLEQHSLGDGGVKLANVERGRVLGVRSSGGGGRSSSIVSGSSDTGVDSRGLGLTAVDRGVVEVVGELVNSAGSSVGGHCEYRFLGLCMNLQRTVVSVNRSSRVLVYVQEEKWDLRKNETRKKKFQEHEGETTRGSNVPVYEADGGSKFAWYWTLSEQREWSNEQSEATRTISKVFEYGRTQRRL
jgi:hypothetical protein